MTANGGPSGQPASPAQIFFTFLGLGLTSFGGPIAHIGFFRNAFVEKRHWLTDKTYTDIVALCHFLPGPSSSQVGMIIGLLRGGLPGMAAAWLGFTLPSALLMIAAAMGLIYAEALTHGELFQGALQGLKLVVVAVVAHALYGMTRSLCPDLTRRIMALAAAVIVLFFGGSLPHVALIAIGGIIGWLILTPSLADDEADIEVPTSRRAGGALLVVFLVLLLAPALVASSHQLVQFFEAFYRSGALVFGGGHVVLPLLQEAVVEPGWLDSETFLAGYGLAQTVPGPLFTFSAYLGVFGQLDLPQAVMGALAVFFIFLPSFFLILGILPFWSVMRRSRTAQRVLMGVNATVVGLLGATFIDPVILTALRGPIDIAIATMFFAIMMWGKIPVWLVVWAGAGLGAALGSFCQFG